MNAITISVTFGFLLFGAQWTLAPIALRALTGPQSIACVPYALTYARIRAVAAIPGEI